ncbi:hypothetical protein [Cupriavidus pampae]|uniref:hypothetical protein n=1 Tax=Cupriavidus pampae TaxID=659251 RepID=UPI001CC542A6|nr:hypothetical protein [Cupriavidus pampae]
MIELKRHFESIARRWHTLSPEEQAQLRKQNVAPQQLRDTNAFVYAFEPEWFIFAALGLQRWHHASYVETDISGIRVVPPWIVAGGLRKRAWFDLDFSTFLNLVPSLDAATLEGDDGHGSTTSWLKPFPLLWAKEGKNRIQCYQDTETTLLTDTRTCDALPASLLRLYRSVVSSSVWILRYVGGDPFWDRKVADMETAMRSGRPFRSILPFPEVGVPLLLNYGVKVDRGWDLPWRIGEAAKQEESRRVRAHGWI